MNVTPRISEDAIPTTQAEAVEMLRGIIAASPGMPATAWQSVNVGAMRLLLYTDAVYTQPAHDDAAKNALRDACIELNLAMAERDLALSVIGEIWNITEPGITPVAERAGKIRALIRMVREGKK